MDTVTEARLAIAMAQIRRHRHHPQEHAARAPGRRSAQVKKFEAGVIRDPITVGPTHVDRRSAAADARAQHLRRAGGRRRASWSASSPAATCASRRSPTIRSRNIMTRKDKLVTVQEGADEDEVHRAAAQASHREGAGGQRRIRAARPDHRQGHPEGARQSRTLPRTTADACASAPRSASAATPKQRVEALVEAGVDVIVVDTAHGHSQGVLERVALGQEALSRSCR